VADFDSILATQSITSQNVFQYTDSQGIKWIVAACPFFQPGKANDPSNPFNYFVILVFAQRSMAQRDLDSLHSNINFTTDRIVLTTIIIVACTVGLTIFLVLCVVQYITRPLEAMRSISEYITEISAEDEDQKDYIGALRRAYFNLNRTDEVGLLAVEYYYIVGILHNNNVEKRMIPKHPSNPFHLGQQEQVDYDHLTWEKFVDSFQTSNNIVNGTAIVENKGIRKKISTGVVGIELSDLDALKSVSRQRKEQATYVPVSTVSSGDTTQPYHIGSERAQENNQFVTIPINVAQVGWFTSLKSQLYLLSAILLIGTTFTMIFTVVSLSSQGFTWMSKSTIEIINTQVTNMRAITFAKSVFVKVPFHSNLSYYSSICSVAFSSLTTSN